jgi:hypothetical protein
MRPFKTAFLEICSAICNFVPFQNIISGEFSAAFEAVPF